jgi:hypothetical protein
MSATTPDVAADLRAKIVALAAAGGFGADFPDAQVAVDAEDRPGGLVAEGCTRVKFSDEAREQFDVDALVRAQTFQVKKRANLTLDPKAAAAKAAMIKLHDAANLIGAWTGASGTVYVDLVARTFPRILEENYVVMDLTAEFFSASTR